MGGAEACGAAEVEALDAGLHAGNKANNGVHISAHRAFLSFMGLCIEKEKGLSHAPIYTLPHGASSHAQQTSCCEIPLYARDAVSKPAEVLPCCFANAVTWRH